MTDDNLSASIALLLDLEAIKSLKHRYMRAVDQKDWDLFATTLTPDATARYGKRLDFTGRDEIVAFMKASVGPEILTVHHVHQPEIDVRGDTATGTWALQDQVIIDTQRIMITGACFYEDRYERDDTGQWRIASTGYTRLFEAIESLDVRTDFRLTDNRWATPDDA